MNIKNILTNTIINLLTVLLISVVSLESNAEGEVSEAEPVAVTVNDEEKSLTEIVESAVTKKDEHSRIKIDVNRFNRLLKKGGDVHHAPEDDGIHDPTNAATRILQNPKEALFDFPKTRSGNQVDWVKAHESGKIKPRNTVEGEDVLPIIMDLNIVMEVKGSMNNVVFPHKPHTAVLDCSNCHPAIFTPQSGSNNISMAENLMGKKCGVCHGKVAFPLSKCTLCHSGKK